MKVLALTILAVFAVIGVFGFFVMDREMTMSHGKSCFASVNGEGPCPLEAPLTFASFHLEALKFFSDATLIFGIAVVLCVLIGFFTPAAQKDKLVYFSFFNYSRKLAVSYLPVLQKKIDWFAIHEKRDPIFATGA